MNPTPYEFMMAQEPRWVSAPPPDPLSEVPHPDNKGEPLRQPAVEHASVGSPSSTAEVEAALLPFEITVTEDTIKAAPGVLDGVTIAETVEASPADDIWYLEAKVVINATTGAVTARSMQWAVTTPSTSTTTDWYDVIGEVEVIGGVPDSSTIVQYNYGPLIVIQYGAVSDKWGVLIF